MTTVTHPVKVQRDLPATFGCSTDIKQPYKWHWMKNGQLIPGAPSAASYSAPPIHESDFGNKYSITVYGRGGEIETSEEVALSLEPPAPELQEEPNAAT
jgi:hypothetical protein